MSFGIISERGCPSSINNQHITPDKLGFFNHHHPAYAAANPIFETEEECKDNPFLFQKQDLKILKPIQDHYPHAKKIGVLMIMVNSSDNPEQDNSD